MVLSILTKISIVVLVVLVLLACPVFITQATVVPDYRDQCKALQLKVTNLSHDYNRVGQALKAANQTLMDRDGELIRLKTASSNEIRKLQEEKVLQAGKSAYLRDSLATLAAGLDEQLNMVLNVNKRNHNKDKLAAEQRIRINDLVKENTSLENQLDKREQEVKLANQAARVYHEKFIESEEVVVDLKNKLAVALQSGSGSTGTSTAVQPAVELKGTILAVEKGIASINIGSAKGVKVGMKLVIYREKIGFVGRLKILQVDANQAGGIVVDAKTKALPGDKITTLEGVTLGGAL